MDRGLKCEKKVMSKYVFKLYSYFGKNNTVEIIADNVIEAKQKVILQYGNSDTLKIELIKKCKV